MRCTKLHANATYHNGESCWTLKLKVQSVVTMFYVLVVRVWISRRNAARRGGSYRSPGSNDTLKLLGLWQLTPCQLCLNHLRRRQRSNRTTERINRTPKSVRSRLVTIKQHLLKGKVLISIKGETNYFVTFTLEKKRVLHGASTVNGH